VSIYFAEAQDLNLRFCIAKISRSA
jgi:hypothetical protein